MRGSGSGWAEPVPLIEDAEAFEETFATLRHIGAGASGRVLLVEHRRTRAKCVLKKIPMMSMKDAGPVMKEVTVLAQLDHPNITRYHGSWHADGCLNILMEYADGGSLADALRGRAEDKAYLDEDVIMDWFVQAARAVHYIHERKIVHRDLKAQNVLLTKRGLIKVCDFGISKVLEETSGGSAGLASTCIGTPFYLSPEIVEAQKYGLPTDIWSLGVLLYEMAALRKPFEADSLPALAMRITRAVYNELPDCFSPELRALVRRLLQRDPAERPTADSLLCDEYVQANEDRFNAQLAELAELAHGLASARASFASPPVPHHRPSALTPPAHQPAAAAAAAGAAVGGESPAPGPTPASDAQAQPALATIGDATLVLGAPAVSAPLDAPPPPLAARVLAQPPRTLGRARGLDMLSEAGEAAQLPARGASLPSATAPLAAERESLAPGAGAGRASVGLLLHAAAGSPQAERAMACALRHELVLETSDACALSPSRLRASLEDNMRFSLNMRALETNLAAAADDDAGAPDATPPSEDNAAGRASDAPRGVLVPSASSDAGVWAHGVERACGASACGSREHGQPAGDAEHASARSPLAVNNAGFVTRRRSRRGERSKARPAVSPATFAAPPPSTAPRAAVADAPAS